MLALLRNSLCFGESYLFHIYYSRFTNKKQRYGEKISALGSDLERLSCYAYVECSYEVRDKIDCAQFIIALSDGFIKRTLQLENINSLRTAIERTMIIKVIQENSFEKNNYGKYKAENNENNYKFKRNAKEIENKNKRSKFDKINYFK